MLVHPVECVGSPEVEALPRCDDGWGPPMGGVCEGDGECNTDPEANNCQPGHWDVYRRVPCEYSAPWG